MTASAEVDPTPPPPGAAAPPVPPEVAPALVEELLTAVHEECARQVLPEATYRIQFNGRFTFRDAAAICARSPSRTW